VVEHSRILLQLPQHPRKVGAHPHAVVRERTAGVDEGQQQRLTAKLAEDDLVPVLIDESEIGYLLSGFRKVQLRRPVYGAVADLAEANVLQPGVIAEDQRGVYLIAGGDGLEDPRVVATHQERHGHAFHQPGNIMVRDGELPLRGVDGDHATVERVTLFLWIMRAGGEDEYG
jgi:hypothetical protein